ncbi:NAD(P)/FAD-dependent oxidoreductase [Flagellimonas onchidii]|uniref:NAD(P)/FAD-dependent oxidoreductase n=1 Tax=Flagellimonas onchidii TaxID=2562684 RepID=UPI001F104B02|nr:NAD(P)/FAD-dependent oxidoreductase [Allomuricauda onchidii]
MSVFLFPNDYLQTVNRFEVVIIGGGLAGLTAALDLVSKGKQVLVIEKNTYPNHKVCGEYVSNEVKPYLQSLGLTVDNGQLPQIDTLQISTSKGNSVEVELPLGGFGISRYTFDNQLYNLAKRKGVVFLHDAVTQVNFQGSDFRIELGRNDGIEARMVIGAHGKRSQLDSKLERHFMTRKSPWLAVKSHFDNPGYPPNLVALHNFPGGYGGLSQIENGNVNFCYLVRYSDFKKERDIDSFNKNVVSQNPFLRDFLSNAHAVFTKPMAIGQISFAKKHPIENHMLMCGDSAGLIHPLCGNGMAMAIHSAKLASTQVNLFLKNPSYTRKEMEMNYATAWKMNFEKRLWAGRRLQGIFMHTKWFDFGIRTLAQSKFLLRNLIRTTHGTPIYS